MLPSLTIRRGSWKTLFIARELPALPIGPDRYVMLAVKAIAGILGTFIISLGPLALLITKSQGVSLSTYGYVLGGAGLAGSPVALIGAHFADKYSRVRVLLWGTLPPIALMFVFGFFPNHEFVLFVVVYVLMAYVDTYAVVTVSALLRDFSPRSGRGLGVGLVTVGTNAATWLSLFMADHLLGWAVTWQKMYLIFALTASFIWVFLWLTVREPRMGVRSQIIPTMKDVEFVAVQGAAMEEANTVENNLQPFWKFMFATWRLWMLAAGEGLFLIGYITFTAYGPAYTELEFHTTPAVASGLVSWMFLSIIVCLILGGILSDALRMRKILGAVFTVITGAFLLVLGEVTGTHISKITLIVLFMVIGGAMAIMWSPTNALFSENAEDINSSRQTTAFGLNGVATRTIYYTWLLIVPTLSVADGWPVVMYIAGACSISTAIVLAFCKGTWWRYKLPSAAEANREVYVRTFGAEAGVPVLPPEPVGAAAAAVPLADGPLPTV